MPTGHLTCWCRFGEAVDERAESHDTGGESTPDNTEFPHFRSAFPVHLRRLRNGPEGGKFLRPVPNFPPLTLEGAVFAPNRLPADKRTSGIRRKKGGTSLS